MYLFIPPSPFVEEGETVCVCVGVGLGVGGCLRGASLMEHMRDRGDDLRLIR